eukprot:GILJ01001737.1.p1 GENE.GILJ01001737.1~~GILJ01001737.1.p1  ORF type:complete len:657 (+),score=88.09 GILJ01001737.1:155-2125(+)
MKSVRLVVLVLLSLCLSGLANPCARHKSCGACVAEEELHCTWCSDEETRCVPVTSIMATAQTPLDAKKSDELSSVQVVDLEALDGQTSSPASALQPFGSQICIANWRVRPAVWHQNENDAIAWSVSHCDAYETTADAVLDQTFGYEAETSVHYRSTDDGTKHSVLSSSGHGRITLDLVSEDYSVLEFVNFPPVSFRSQQNELNHASEYFSAACKEIGREGLDILSNVILKDEGLSQAVLNKFRPMLGVRKALEKTPEVWIPASSVTRVDTEKGELLPPYAFLHEVQMFKPTTTADRKRCAAKNAVLATLQFTASIPLKSFLDVLGKDGDKYIRVLSNGVTPLTNAARWLKNIPDEELSQISTDIRLSPKAVWTTEFKSVIAMLAYYVSAFQDKATNLDREKCHLQNPKDETLRFNIRSNFYDLLRAVYTLQYKDKGMEEAFPIQKAQDLVAIIEAVTKHCRLISPGGCPFEKVLLGGLSITSRKLPNGEFAVVKTRDWLVQLIDGKRDILNDAHVSLAALPVQFRGGEAAVIIEFRSPQLSSTRCGLLPAAASLYYEYISALLENQGNTELDKLIERITAECRKASQVCEVDKRSLRQPPERSTSFFGKTVDGIVSVYNTVYNTAYSSVANSMSYVLPSKESPEPQGKEGKQEMDD